MSLVLNDVRKSFHQGDTEIQVLKGLNVTIEPGQIVSVVGQSGSGKSTLLSILAGLERADRGEILVDKVNLSPLSEQELTLFRAQNISIVFQQYHLIAHLTALENVMLALEILKLENPRERAQEALRELGLGHRLDHFPRSEEHTSELQSH